MAAKLSSLLLFVGWASILSCHPKEPVIAILPGQLLGTWTSQAGATSEKPFIRWTFKPDYVHTLEDTVKSCQPLDNQHYYNYWLEGNMLVMRYQGISIGLSPGSDIRRRISSITPTEIVLDEPRQILEKCP